MTVRIHVGDFHREADLSIPTGSALSEILDDVTQICEAPTITRPWRAMSAAGTPIDMAAPIGATGVQHGAVVVLTPAEPVDAPVIRDSAEALVARVQGPGAVGALTAAVAAGTLGVVALVWMLAGAQWGWAAGCVSCLVVWLYSRRRSALALVVAVCAAIGAMTFVAGGWQVHDPAQAGWTGLAGAVAVSVTAGLAVLLHASRRITAFLVTLSALSLITCSVLFLPGVPDGHILRSLGATGVVAGLGAIASIPALCTALAGLEVPRLPTAGQDLSYSDPTVDRLDERATAAGQLLDGASLAVALVMVGSAAALGWGGGTAATLCLVAMMGATGLHAARIRSSLPAWAMSCIALSCVAAAALATARTPGEPHPVIVGLIGALCLVVLSSPAWATHAGNASPTVKVWWERAEMAALILALPLAAWASGMVGAVRGLG